MKIKPILALAALVAAGAAWSQTSTAPVVPAKDPTATPRLDAREANQKRRIEQGKASGQLTPKEAAQLEKREAKLEAHEQAAKADGKVTPAERRRLQREADRNSRAIYRQKHDKQKTAPASK